MRAIVDSDRSTVEKLRAAIIAAAAPYDEYFPELFMYFNDFYPALDRVDPAPRLEYEELWIGLVRLGIDEGVIRSDVDPRLMMYGMLGMIAWMHKWYSAGDGASATEIGAQFADVLLQGLLV
jgi:hypothetical protein